MQAAAGRMHRCICGSNHFIFIFTKARIPELHNQLLHKKLILMDQINNIKTPFLYETTMVTER